MFCQIITGLGLASKSPTPVVQMLATCYGLSMVSCCGWKRMGVWRCLFFSISSRSFSLLTVDIWYIYIYIRHRWTFEYTVYIRDQFFFASGRRARRFDIRQVDVVLNWWFFQSLLDVDGGGSQNSMDIKPSGHGVFNFLLPRISAKKDVKFATSDSTPNCFFQLRNLTWGLCPRADGVSHFQEGYCSSQILGYQALRLLGGCFFS